MMKKTKALAGILFFLLITRYGYSQDAFTLTRDLISSVKAIKTIRFDFDSNERIKGKMVHHETSMMKITLNPFKAYIHQNYPASGIEGLYIAGENSGKMKINPNSFPWITLNLDPEGELILQNRHHPITHAGFTYTISILEELISKYQANASKLITYNGIVKFQGTECYFLTLTNPNYRLTLYNTLANETPLSISKKLKINYYSILENNPGCKATTVFTPGTRLIVPNDYASRMDMFIHVSKMYPVNLKVFDTKGLFEEFSFSNVVLNPSFRSIDFSPKNPEYNF